jgi:Zn-dependent protease
MRDPMSWAVTVFRAFGVPVKMHLAFFVVSIGLFVRQMTLPGNAVWWVDVFLLTVVILFVTTVLHEFGHCFAGRAVGGEPHEIVIWPLGGLAFVEVPQNWRAHTVTAAGGPLVNLVICVLGGAAIAGAGFVPNFSPLANPYTTELRCPADGRTYTSEYGQRYYKPGTAEEVPPAADKPAEAQRAVLPTWVVWVQRVFWLNWILLLLNLLPGYPLDGGQLLQGAVWARSGYRQGVAVAVYAGYLVAVLMLVASISINETLLLCLAVFVFYSCYTRLSALEAEDGLYGDFSQGYLSLERDDPPARRPKPQNFLKRWLQARAARRLQREIEQRQRDEERMDQLLDKIAKFGKGSLTDEERRFMERVSARYRDR